MFHHSSSGDCTRLQSRRQTWLSHSVLSGFSLQRTGPGTVTAEPVQEVLTGKALVTQGRSILYPDDWPAHVWVQGWVVRITSHWHV